MRGGVVEAKKKLPRKTKRRGKIVFEKKLWGDEELLRKNEGRGGAVKEYRGAMRSCRGRPRGGEELVRRRDVAKPKAVDELWRVKN